MNSQRETADSPRRPLIQDREYTESATAKQTESRRIRHRLLGAFVCVVVAAFLWQFGEETPPPAARVEISAVPRQNLQPLESDYVDELTTILAESAADNAAGSETESAVESVAGSDGESDGESVADSLSDSESPPSTKNSTDADSSVSDSVDSASSDSADSDSSDSAKTVLIGSDAESDFSATDGKYHLQLGAFGSKKRADKLAARLREESFRVKISPTVREGKTLYRVRVVGFAKRTDAKQKQLWLLSHGYEEVNIIGVQ